MTLGVLKAYARYRPVASRAGDKVSVVGRYEFFMVENIPFQSEKLAAVKITHVDVQTSGNCIIDGKSISLFSQPHDFCFAQDFQEEVVGRLVSHMQKTLFE